MGHTGLNYRHAYSAEKVAHKQAFIDNNFEVEHIFRDVREMAEGQTALVYPLTSVEGSLTILDRPLAGQWLPWRPD